MQVMPVADTQLGYDIWMQEGHGEGLEGEQRWPNVRAIWSLSQPLTFIILA